MARLSTAGLLALSAPTIVFAGYELAQRVLLPDFLTHNVGIDVAVAGLIITCTRLLDIVLDTLVGALSDAGLSGRWGRRGTWMVLGAPAAVGGMIGLFAMPAGAGPVGVVGWMTLMVVGWAMINSAHGAWALESASGMMARSRVFVARGIAGIVGFLSFSGLVAIAGPHLGAQLTAVAIAVSVGVPLTTLFLIWLVRDPPSPRARVSLSDLVAPLYLSLDTPRKRRLTLLFGLVGAQNAVGAGSFVYLLKYGLGLPDVIGVALLCQSAATAVGLPTLLWVSRRIGPQSTLLLTFSLEMAIGLGALLLPGGQAMPAIIWVALRGFGAGMDFVLLRAYAGEELDVEVAQTGASRAGAYYAAFHLYFNLANALATGALFAAFGAAGMEAGAPGVDEADPHVRLYVLLPALAGTALYLAAIGVVASWRPKRAETEQTI